MSLLSIFGCGRAKTPEYPADRLSARDGTEFTITFFKHASLAISVGGKYIYVDPVSANADYGALPKADVVLITHSHYDHLDVAAVEKLLAADTEILCDRTSAEAFEMNCYTMRPGSVATPRDYVKVEAVAAYNTTPGHLQFHPREREDCGYVLTIGGTRIYIAGDTEPTPELKALRKIDIAFLPVNQPYTMTVDQAVEAVKALKPAIFYPYHYGEVDEKTDIDRLARELEGVTEVRIRPMEQRVRPCKTKSVPAGRSFHSGPPALPPAGENALHDERDDQSQASENEHRTAINGAARVIGLDFGYPGQHKAEKQPGAQPQQQAADFQRPGRDTRSSFGRSPYRGARPQAHRHQFQVIDQRTGFEFPDNLAPLAAADKQFEELVNSQRDDSRHQRDHDKIHNL